MKTMSKLDDMINQLCPEGVEFVKLGEVCKNICSGGTPATSKADYYDGDIPWLRTQEVDYCEIHATLRNITKKGLDNSSAKMIPVNCVIVAMYGATAAKVAINKIPLCTNQACCNLHIDNKKANYKFVYYWLCKQYEILKGLGEGTQHNINAMKVKKFEIPLPPLEVQNEIVRILDHFTQLEAELEAELDCRKRQYEYYRDQLLNFDNANVKMVKMGDFFTFKNGINKGKQFFGSGNYIVNFTDVYKNRWLKKEMLKGRVQAESKDLLAYDARKGDLFFTRTSETKEDIGMVSTLVDDVEDCVFSGFVLRARPLTNNWSPKFCSYYFSTTQMRQQIVRYASFTTRALTSGPRLSKLLLPQIPLSEQERIVAILDRFEALTTSLQEGLPAEIAARRQQYEYYRDRLLDFKKKTA